MHERFFYPGIPVGSSIERALQGLGITEKALVTEISLSESAGQMMAQNLNIIFTQVGFDTNLMQQYGALCLDVGSGAEIAALDAYNPSQVIAAEPFRRSLVGPQDPFHESMLILATITSLAARREGVQIMDVSAPEALTSVTNSGTQFGLVTHLNMFPTNFINYTVNPGSGGIPDPEYLLHIIPAVMEILVPGGLLVASTVEERGQKTFDLVKSRLQTISKTFGHTIDRIDTTLGSAGNSFLIIKK